MNSIEEFNYRQLQRDYDTLDACCELLRMKIIELKAENERLKEENEIRDNLSEKFRKEALSWANIANEYQKDKTKLEQTLQEIKAIAEDVSKEKNFMQYSFEDFNEILTQILQIIKKAEEE